MASTSGEDIRDIHPRKGTPAHRVEAHVDVKHRSHSFASRWRSGTICQGGWRRVSLEDSSDDEEQSAHSESRDEERDLASCRLDHEEDEERCRNGLDDTVDTGRQQRIRRALVADRREDLRCVVADRVLSCPLLEEEDDEGDDEADEVALSEECLLESKSFARFLFLLNLRLDLSHLVSYRFAVGMLLAEVR